MTARWHTHPVLCNSGDTIDLHQPRVALLCNTFATALGLPDDRRRELDFAAQHHDEAERVLGDMPGPAKDRFPALAAAYAKAELQVLTERGLTWNLTRQEAAILHLADKLDGELWARRHGVTGAHDADKLMKQAEALGLGDIVGGMLG